MQMADPHTGIPAPCSSTPPAPPCTLVIFGVTGDLTHRLLMPAIYNLSRAGLLAPGFSIIGIGRRASDRAAMRRDLTASVRKFVESDDTQHDFDDGAWARVEDRIDVLEGDVTSQATYDALRERLAGTAVDDVTNVLFYLAISDKLFGTVVERLGDARLTDDSNGWRRVIIEKPFGHDLPSAKALNAKILGVLREDQVFRIDHYLGKETVQNIMAFRFGNGFFEPVWNRNYIDHVQITVAETLGVEQRGSFYDATGALRDMVPNHLFQLFTMTAMEPPVSFDAVAVRNKKEDVLSALRPLDPQRDAVRAQYGEGHVAGKVVPSYRDEEDVSARSNTETYFAMRMQVDNWRWAGVPFYMRTGKSLKRRNTQIAIMFKQAPLSLFRNAPMNGVIPNWLVMQIQPDESISMQFGAKVPGPQLRLSAVDMNFSYQDHFERPPSTGYETLIYDAMIGDATLYQRADHIEAGWRAVQPALDLWSRTDGAPPTYPAGSEGPVEADRLLAEDGRAWRPL